MELTDVIDSKVIRLDRCIRKKPMQSPALNLAHDYSEKEGRVQILYETLTNKDFSGENLILPRQDIHIKAGDEPLESARPGN